MKGTLFAKLVFAGACASMAMTSAHAVTILGTYDKLAGENSFAADTSGINPQQHKGVLFTTTDAYQIDDLFLSLTAFNDTDDDLITIRENDINGAVVGTFGAVFPAPSGSNASLVFQFDPITPLLLAPGSYAIDLRELSASYSWSVDSDTGNVAPTGAASFDGYQFQEFGNAVVGSTTFNSFRLTGDLVPATVPVPGAAWLMALPLAAWFARRRRAA